MNKYDLPKRSRYYHSQIDIDFLKKGESYNILTNNVVIFICTFDPFGEGKHSYVFRNWCDGNKELCLNDGIVTVILNTKGIDKDVSEELDQFLEYVEKTNDKVADQYKNNHLVTLLHNRVKQVVEDEEMVGEFMTLQEKFDFFKEEGREEGREEGIRIAEERAKKREEMKNITLRRLIDSGEIMTAKKLLEDDSMLQELYDKYCK